MSLAILALALALASATALQAQTYSVLYNFSPGTKSGDPSNPFNTGQIAQGRDGDLWTTTRSGGTFSAGAAFGVTPAGGTLPVQYNFDYSSAAPGGASPYSGLILGTDGNFYGTTEAGGTRDAGTLFKLTSTGAETTLYSFDTCTPPCTSALFPQTPPVQASDGNFTGRHSTPTMEPTTAWCTS